MLSDGLFCLDELFGVIDLSHDVIISGLFGVMFIDDLCLASMSSLG
jgi:hypothetical protein